MKLFKDLKSSIIYVNFAPYENTGKILDFLLDTFEHVALFSFNFHHLGKKARYNKLKVYLGGKEIETKNLFDFQVPESIIFLLLPIRSIFIFIQILLYTFYLTIKFGKFQYYFTVNAFTAWTGIIVKKFGLVNKTIFWVWDYYPPFHESKIITFMRRLYWQFDKLAARSDTLVFLNKRLANLRKEIGVLDENSKYKIIPIGTTESYHKIYKKFNESSSIKLVFVGVIKKSQGLDLLFDSGSQISAIFPKIEACIIGGGPDLSYFKKRSISSGLKTKFYGYLPDNQRDKILSKSHIGLATYIPSSDNVSYYGDPSKIKQYLSYGLPVITTDVFEFSKEVRKNKAGLIINYEKNELPLALSRIIHNFQSYSKDAFSLSGKFYYKSLYKKFLPTNN